MSPVVGPRPGPLAEEVGPDADGRPEQEQRLVDEVWPEVEPEPRTGAVALAPPITYLGPETVEVRLEVRDGPVLCSCLT